MPWTGLFIILSTLNRSVIKERVVPVLNLPTLAVAMVDSQVKPPASFLVVFALHFDLIQHIKVSCYITRNVGLRINGCTRLFFLQYHVRKSLLTYTLGSNCK